MKEEMLIKGRKREMISFKVNYSCMLGFKGKRVQYDVEIL